MPILAGDGTSKKRKKRTLLGHVTKGAARGALIGGLPAGLVVGTALLPELSSNSIPIKPKLRIIGNIGKLTARDALAGAAIGSAVGAVIYGGRKLINRIQKKEK